MKINAEQYSNILAVISAGNVAHHQRGELLGQGLHAIAERLERIEQGQGVLCERVDGLIAERRQTVELAKIEMAKGKEWYAWAGDQLKSFALQVAVLDQRCHEIQGALLEKQFRSNMPETHYAKRKREGRLLCPKSKKRKK